MDEAQHGREQQQRSKSIKITLTVVGIISVSIGTIGVFVPLLPTTPFLLLAAACFMRSSDRLYDWLMHHRWFGTYIRNYREHHAITLPTKILAILLLWSTLSYAALAVTGSWFVRILLLSIAVGVTIHLVTLKTLTRDMMAATRRKACPPQEEPNAP